MTSASPFDDAHVDRLSELLEQRAVPFNGLSLEALDGFLSALAVGPDSVPEDEWQPVVWGGKPPRWEADEAGEVASLLAGHRQLAEQRVRHGGDPLPDRLAPLLWLPEDPEAAHQDSLDIGHDWAIGFFRGVAMREQAWETWLDQHAWIDEVFSLLDRLASGESLAEDPGEAADPLDYRERLDIIASLPGMLADLHHHRIDMLTPRTPARRAATPERNAACPCGSGRKYKKCCGS